MYFELSSFGNLLTKNMFWSSGPWNLFLGSSRLIQSSNSIDLKLSLFMHNNLHWRSIRVDFYQHLPCQILKPIIHCSFKLLLFWLEKMNNIKITRSECPECLYCSIRRIQRRVNQKLWKIWDSFGFLIFVSHRGRS